jgi:hypothetical protein
MREVDFNNITDDDVQYIRQRPWLVNEALVQGIDLRDRVYGEAEPTESAAEVEDVHEIVAPEEDSEPNPDVDADDYDDEEAWSYEELKAEVKERRDAMGDESDAPALNSSRAELVSWLRMDNARE